jgi:hypothetical protein
MVEAEGRHRNDLSRSEFASQEARLHEELHFLKRLQSISPKRFWKPKRGQPRNSTAYLILRDAAAIFSWYTGNEPKRGVTKGKESGPFFRFAFVLWPVVFGKGTVGLSAAMKNWDESEVKGSAVIASMAVRHPPWGLYEE